MKKLIKWLTSEIHLMWIEWKRKERIKRAENILKLQIEEAEHFWKMTGKRHFVMKGDKSNQYRVICAHDFKKDYNWLAKKLDQPKITALDLMAECIYMTPNSTSGNRFEHEAKNDSSKR